MLKGIKLSNFRNHALVEVGDLGMLNILIGPNASGKTSIIEAIQLMTACSSFRTSQLADVVKHGAQNSSVDAFIEGDGRNLHTHMLIENGRRSYHINDQPRRLNEIKGTLPAVVFCPDDLELVKGSNSARLATIDGVASQLSTSFRSVKSDYTQLVKQKNQALKDEADDALLDSIDTVLVKVSAQLTNHRQYVVATLASALQNRYQDLAGDKETAQLFYQYSWEEPRQDFSEEQTTLSKTDITHILSEKIAQCREDERAHKRALYGAHADKITFTLESKNATKFASQGQQRSLVLAFKLAELDTFNILGEQQPVLLLDDVMSELDQTRRQRFMDIVDEKVQTFVTTTNEEYFTADLLNKARVIRLPFQDETHQEAEGATTWAS